MKKVLKNLTHVMGFRRKDYLQKILIVIIIILYMVGFGIYFYSNIWSVIILTEAVFNCIMLLTYNLINNYLSFED